MAAPVIGVVALVAVVWTAISVLLGGLIARGIRIADRLRPRP